MGIATRQRVEWWIRKRAAFGATLLETPAQGSFRTQNPRAPLPLRAGMEAENAITTASPMVYNI